MLLKLHDYTFYLLLSLRVFFQLIFEQYALRVKVPKKKEY
jgi:hypothetical protein